MESPCCFRERLVKNGDVVAKAIATTDKSFALTPDKEGVIYWHLVEPLTKDQDKFKTILAFEKAFKEWQKYFYPIEFKSTGDPKIAPIKIHFMDNSSKGLPEKFDPGVLAYAYFPSKRSLGIHSDMFFNDSYAWAEMHSVDKINLFKVVVHELGHALGLDHSKLKSDVMYPTYQPNDSVVITRDTLDGIDYLYEDIKASIKPTTPEEAEPKIPPPPVVPEEPKAPEEPETEDPKVEDTPPETPTAPEPKEPKTEQFIREFFVHRFQFISLTNDQLNTLAKALNVTTNRRAAKIDIVRKLWKKLAL